MAYQEIVDYLKKLLESNSESSFLVISPDGYEDVYIQFLPLSENELYCESVSNEFLPEKLELTSQKVAQLEELGFKLGAEDVNFNREYEIKDETAIIELSKMVYKIFVEIYGVIVSGLTFDFTE